MYAARYLHRKISELWSCRSGNIAMMFGLALIPLLVTIGIAVDYARSTNIKNQLQLALDAASLAVAARDFETLKEAEDYGKLVFDANFDANESGISVTPNFRAGQDGKFEADVSVVVPTTFMRVVGIDTVSVASSTEVIMPTFRKGEVVLVLDYSGSMNSRGKYQTMRDASIDLVNKIAERDDEKLVAFGLVPFSHHVYTDLASDYIIGEEPGGHWSGCTQDRKYPANTTSETPSPAKPITLWGHPQAPAHANYGCDGYNGNGNGYLAKNLTVQPLTDDYQSVTNQLSLMTPYAWTHIALGFEFGWHVLSPNSPFTEGVAYDDETVLKSIVLLTDGEQTEPSYGPGGNRSVGNGEDNLKELCDAAKAQGILVLTVAFDLDDRATRRRLRNCASARRYFHVAEDNEDLSKAFQKITNQLIKALRISK